MPDEYRPHGKRLLVEAPEFRLVEIWSCSGKISVAVEWCEAVQMAYVQSRGNIQQGRRKTELQEVLSMINALTMLAAYSKHGEGSRQICNLMTRALARSLETIESAADSAIAESEAVSLCASVFSGYSSLVGSKGKDRRRNTSRPTPADLIEIAAFLIEGEMRVPSKDEVREFAEGIGLRITGKRAIDQEWIQLFTDAGLSGLPPSPEK